MVKLPPTYDAQVLLMLRCSYHAIIWLEANEARPELPNPKNSGWYLDERAKLCSRLNMLEQVPTVCAKLLVCRCKTTCTSLR